MSFFNATEDVIHFDLTDYGKKQLAKGKFDPFSYSFHDNDILYDGACASIVEEQNDVEKRILTSPRTRHVHTCDPSMPLGNGNIGSEHSSGWSINVLNGCVESVSQVQSGSTSCASTANVTEITLCDIEYKILEATNGEVILKDDYLLLEIAENETQYGNENFDVYVSRIKEETMSNNAGGGVVVVENPLAFVLLPADIVDGILVDKPKIVETSPDSSEPAESFGTISDPSIVDYFLDILTDEGIEESILCAAKSRIIHDGNIIRGSELSCPLQPPLLPSAPSPEVTIPGTLCPEKIEEKLA